MILVSAIVGLVLRELVKYWWSFFEDMMKYTTSIKHCNQVLSDKSRFWIAHPSMFNPICGTLLAVFFYSGWWGRLWHRGAVIAYATCVTTYAGLYDSLFYVNRPWANALVGNEATSAWRFFVAFAALPLITAAVTSIVFCLMRRRKSLTLEVLPVYWGFWLAMPLGLATGFGGMAMFAFAPLLEIHGGNTAQIEGFVIAHASNGAVLGLTFGALILIARNWHHLWQRIGF